MRILYLDCSMGASGDMLMGALYELCEDKDKFLEIMNTLFDRGIQISAKPDKKCGISGTHMQVLVHGCEEHEAVEHSHSHSHSSAGSIFKIIDAMPVDDVVKQDAKNVYEIIAQAESTVHGTSVEQVHFHEVGALDAVADVIGVCLLVRMLRADKICASAVHVGSGQVRCAHGLMPVPAPATALILRSVPCYGGYIDGELCTPTGAALLKYFADEFGPMPLMSAEAVGCGTGSRDFDAPNCLRAFIGRTEDSGEQVCAVECNLDDMTPEAVGYVMDLLLENGALDVYTTAIGMKKNRPGIMLTCLCADSDADKFASLMLRHTSTLGVRMLKMQRRVMHRIVKTLSTPLGDVRVKYSKLDAVEKAKPEYDDVARIAEREKMSFAQVYAEIMKYI